MDQIAYFCRLLSRPGRRGEGGFTLIELFVTMAIIAILSALSYTAFFIYKTDAEYAKAEATLRQARTAFEVGDQDAQAGDSVPVTFTDSTGGPVQGVLATILPGAVTAAAVRLGAEYNFCTNATPPATVNQLLISQPCNGDRYTSYMLTCGGLEIIQRNVAINGCPG